MENLEKILNPNFWKSFRIPACSFAVLALLLLMRNVNNASEYVYIQKLANYTIGASIISYGHFLFWATWKNHKKELDLPFWAQFIAMLLHISWFIFFVLSINKG